MTLIYERRREAGGREGKWKGNRPGTQPKEYNFGLPLAPWDDLTIAEIVSIDRIWIRLVTSDSDKF